MIEVNLLPGARRKSSRRARFSLSLPGIRGLSGIGLPKVDGWTVGAAAAVLLLVGGSVWFAIVLSGDAEEVGIQTEVAVRDSVRFADILQESGALQSRRDSIAQRVAIIQEIDGTRYVWAHLMDEVGRALPDYTWYTRFAQLAPGEEVTGGDIVFQIEGRAGTYFALTSLMENLEASPFIRDVQLITSAQTQIPVGEGVNQLVYEFVIEASTLEPPPELLQTVPLFEASVIAPNEGG